MKRLILLSLLLCAAIYGQDLPVLPRRFDAGCMTGVRLLGHLVASSGARRHCICRTSAFMFGNMPQRLCLRLRGLFWLGRRLDGILGTLLDVQMTNMERLRHEKAMPSRMLVPRYVGNARVTVHASMLSILHNMVSCPSYSTSNVEQKLRGCKIDFGLADVKFIPYWKENASKFLRASAGEIKISIYERPNGDFMAAVFNSGSQTVVFRLEVPGDFRSATWYDPLTDVTQHWRQSTPITLEPHMGGLLTIRR